jgi:hypothetical protein
MNKVFIMNSLVNLDSYFPDSKSRVTVWYVAANSTRDFLGMCANKAQEYAKLELGVTHIQLCEFFVSKEQSDNTTCEQTFIRMQGENWSPQGEARDLIASKGLSHTSFSVGDIVQIDGTFYASNGFEFIPVEFKA